MSTGPSSSEVFQALSALTLTLIAAGAALLIVALAAAIVAWRGETRLLAMRDAPTLSVAEVTARHGRAALGVAAFGQPVELVGTLECDAPLRAPYSETLCVAYEYDVAEENERLIGRPGRGRRFEFGGLDAQERRAQRFYLRDATGRIAVDPAGAQIELVETVARYEQYSGLGGNERAIWRTERALPLGNRVYVLGYLGDDGGAPLIGHHPSEAGRRFIISHRHEGALMARASLRAYGLYIGSVLGIAGAVACFIAAAVR